MRADGRAARPRATAERVRGAPQPDSQRFPTICCWSASTNIRWACLGRRYGPRRRRAPPWPAAPRCRATAERVRGAPRPDSQRFPTIFRLSASINIRGACVGRGYGPRPRRAPLWPRRHGVALGPKPLRLGATGTELQRAAGQRRPYEPLGHGVTAGGPLGGAHIARLGLSEPHPEASTVSTFQLHPRPARNRCRVQGLSLIHI